MRASTLPFVCLVLSACIVHAAEGISVDDLIARAQIPLATMSPDGQQVAYVLVRGDPIDDSYDVSVEVAGLRGRPEHVTICEYRLAPDEAFDETEGFLPSAAEVRWDSGGHLLFLRKWNGKMELASWDGRRIRTLLAGHDRIVISPDQAPGPVRFTVSDFEDRPAAVRPHVPDNAWRIRDAYRFFGALKNPTLGKWVESREGSLSLLAPSPPVLGEKASQGWLAMPMEWRAPANVESDADSTLALLDETPSPDGTLTAMVEAGSLNLRHPEASYTSSRIKIRSANTYRVLVPFSRPRRRQSVFGWSSDSKGVFYTSVGPTDSTVNLVTVSGRVSTIYRDSGQLEPPGEFFGRHCQIISRDGRSAVLIRSTNVIPAQLIVIDLRTGRVAVIADPNRTFVDAAQPEVRFYPVEGVDGDVYGRLYLPLHYREGTRYPLVFTQYYSQPGFYASTGDEIPILPLTSAGIAVFTMHSHELAQVSSVGDFQTQLSRVRRPLAAMESVYGRLYRDGIIQPDRVAVTGVSYGAEIAMYAYWRSKIFRTVSVAGTSWDPGLVPFVGLGYAARLERTGFPLSSGKLATQEWRELAVGPNSTATLPPLLLQTPDREENVTIPTWFQVRRAGAPVEWYEYPNEGHVKRGPANKWWVYERNLDWFRFWLKDEEDPAPDKVEQYQRWREMRARWQAARAAATDHAAH